MAFVRSSEPFQEPPQQQPRGPLAIGIAVLLIFFVPLLVVIAMGRGSTPAPVAAGPTLVTPSDSVPGPSARRRPPMPPLPPPGAPWPPPPGAPTPPVCSLEYRVDADGGTSWTALTTMDGELSVTAVAGGEVHRQQLDFPAGVRVVALPRALSQDHGLGAVLSGSGGRQFDCLVGPQA
jgi:hypothetical protein